MVDWLRADFGLAVVELRAAGGSDSAAQVWQAVTADGARYAVKWTSGGSAAGILLPATLALRGMPVHLRTVGGAWWSDRDGRRLSVAGWVAGRSGVDWEGVGDLLRRLHAVPVDAGPTLPADDGARRAVDAVALVESRLATADDPVGREAAEHWRAIGPRVSAAVALAEAHPPVAVPVICHGDPHLGNVVLSAEGPVLVDWDDAVVAAPERDLALLLGGMGRFGARTDRERGRLLDGYGSQPDEGRLTFYRCVRAVEDAGLWLADALDTGAPADERSRALAIARDVAAPGGLLPLALEPL
ncbi:phosphotransferase [Cellulomonas sp. ICMP 17802]|uniref:phosphotransferase n=1 Tax=Cellulomonas sp. ICMP 17802 TaxID=3239199 RepID=UPI00351BC306